MPRLTSFIHWLGRPSTLIMTRWAKPSAVRLEPLESRVLLASSPFVPSLWPVPVAMVATSKPESPRSQAEPPAASIKPPKAATPATVLPRSDAATRLGLTPDGRSLAILLTAREPPTHPPVFEASAVPIQITVNQGTAARPVAVGQEAFLTAEIPLEPLTQSV